MSERAGRLDLGVIGVEAPGLTLARALAAAGHNLIGLAAGSSQAVEVAERLLPDTPLLDVPELLATSDLVLLALPAELLEPTVNELSANGWWRSGQLVAHTAAEFGIGVLNPALRAGVIPLALHPAMTFTGTSLDVRRLNEIHFAVTAPNAALPIAQALVIEMGGEPIIVDDAERPTYAEAIEVAADFSQLIVQQAQGLLESIGIDDPSAIIGPLVRSAVDKVLSANGGTDD